MCSNKQTSRLSYRTFFRRFKKQTLVTFRDAWKRGLLRNPLFFSRIERNPGKCWENECLESTNRDDGRVFVSRVASTRAEFYMLILMHRWFEILRVTAAKHQNIRYSVWSDLRNIRNANRKHVCIFTSDYWNILNNFSICNSMKFFGYFKIEFCHKNVSEN